MSKNTIFEEDVEGLIEDRNKTIKFLQQQLAEKDEELNEKEHMSERIIELEELLKYEKEDKIYIEQQLDQLKQQLEEKDNLIEFGREEIRKRNKRIDEIVERDKKLFDNKNKEIECLNKRIDRYENMFRSRIKRTGDMQKDIELYINQLAIHELEKVKNFVDGRTYCADYIKKRIKELKGEKE